jgi:hypothetical protein
MATPKRNPALIAATIIGVGLMVAPVVFQMFTRAPLGATMIDDFNPYMTIEKIDEFRGHLGEIGAAETETVQALRPILEANGVDSAAYDATYPNATIFDNGWAAIDTDMTDLLDTMDANLDNFAAVKALPSFNLFPWFFVLPGLFIAALAIFASQLEILWIVGAALALGNSIGGYLGAKFTISEGEKLIKLILNVVLVLFIIKLLLP